MIPNNFFLMSYVVSWYSGLNIFIFLYFGWVIVTELQEFSMASSLIRNRNCKYLQISACVHSLSWLILSPCKTIPGAI